MTLTRRIGRSNSLVLAVVVASAAPCIAADTPAVSYKLYCSGCHLDNGMGAKLGQIPPIPGLTGHFLKHPKGRMYLAHVPGFSNSGLPTAQLAPLLNYVLEIWATNDLPPEWKRFTGDELDELQKLKVDDVAQLRQEIANDLAKQGIDLRY